MAWNGSNTAKSKISKAPQARSLNYFLYIIIGLSVLAIAIFLGSDFLSTDISQGKSNRSDAPIDSVEHSKNHNRLIADNGATSVLPCLRESNHDVYEVSEAVQKTARTIRRVITNSVNQVKDPMEVFKHRAEVELAFLACLPFGTPVIGSFDYNEDFIADLKASLDEKIDIDPEDNDETVYYKESVIQLKKEIKELIAQGKDIAQLLSETRDELQELGVYKTEVEIMVNKVQTENDLEDNDLSDLVNAANEMLAAKGIEPLHFNPITRMIMRSKPVSVDEDQLDDDVMEEEQ